MRRLLSTIVGGAVLAVAFPAIALASPNPAVTFVSGTVKHGASTVSGASVTVTCDTNVLHATTNASGGYAVEYNPATLCPVGQTATVAATDGSLTGSNSGNVTGLTTKLNVDVVNVSIVPEMGAIAATAAVVIGAGAFLTIRRHKSTV